MTAREREKEIMERLNEHTGVISLAEIRWLLARNERLETALREMQWHPTCGCCIGCGTPKSGSHSVDCEAESILNESDANKAEGSE